MTSPLSGSLARTIGKAMAPLFLPAVLVRDVPQVSPDPADPLPPLPANFPCRAMVEAYSDYFKANSLVAAGDRKVLILSTSLGTKPKPDDRVTIRGITFTLSDGIEIDPAEAVWVCKGKMG